MTGIVSLAIEAVKFQETAMNKALHFLTIAEAARRLEAKELSPVELVEALLDRIESLNPQLDAFVTLLGEQALDVARQTEDEIVAGRYRGPLPPSRAP